MTDLDRLRDAVVQAAVELDALFNSGCPYLSDARNKLHRAILAYKKAFRQTAGCVSAAPTGCVSDSECAAAGRCLEQSDAHPAPRATAETVEVRAWVERSDSGQTIRVCGSSHDGGMTWHSAERVKPIAILSARVPLPAIPTIVADATLRLDTEAAG